MMDRGNRVTRRTGRLMGAAAVAAAGVVALGVAAPGASAATPKTSTAPAPYNGVCGTGYKVVNSAPVGTVGMAYLTWNATTGLNCVVEIRNVPGTPVPMSLGIANDEIRNNNDDGDYSFYAGPLYEPGRATCMNWWGNIGPAGFSRWQTNCA
jgi:hypothetical protein